MQKAGSMGSVEPNFFRFSAKFVWFSAKYEQTVDSLHFFLELFPNNEDATISTSYRSLKEFVLGQHLSA